MRKHHKILLHACCAPCVTVPVKRLAAESIVDVVFYNPNISPEDEYLLRQKEIVALGQRWDFHVLSGQYDHETWRQQVLGLENEPERGIRCQVCIRMRLKKTAFIAKESDYDAFTSTLTLSPLKDAAMIHKIGQEIAEQTGIEFFAVDFKKQDGYKQSLKYSKDEKLYRQNYCGCQFSRKRA